MVFCTFIGEIDGGNCPLNGDALTPSHLLFSASLKSAIMKIHGLCYHPLYQTWCGIIKRCYYLKAKRYDRYGGRGIKVFDEWRNDFKAFYDYVTSLPDYEVMPSLDRIDNDKNYEPGNMRWVNQHVQCANRLVSKNNKTGYTGVKNGWREGKYISYIKVYGEFTHIKTCNSIEEAATARDQYIIDNELLEYPLQILDRDGNRKTD